MTTEPTPKLFCVLELFGHSRIAGQISEQTIGGASFVRVDVPEILARETDGYGPSLKTTERTIQAHTRTFGPAAIYSINWCDEETAKVAAHDIKHEPMRPYSVREAINNLPTADRHRLLTSHRERDFEREEEERDDVPF